MFWSQRDACWTASENELKEFERFTGLKWIGVICNPNDPDFGETYGRKAMQAMSEKHGEPGPGKWPRLDCLNEYGIDGQCLRHWWFDGWNQRASVAMKEGWQKTFAGCLMFTAQIDGGDFLLNLWFSQQGYLIP